MAEGKDGNGVSPLGILGPDIRKVSLVSNMQTVFLFCLTDATPTLKACYRHDCDVRLSDASILTGNSLANQL